MNKELYIDTEEKVNGLIVKICDHIEEVMKSGSVADREQLPILIDSLSKLIS